MTLSDLYPEKELELELSQIDDQIKTAASRNDTGTLKKLVQRKKELPELIQQARLRDIEERIRDQQTKLDIYKFDFEKALDESRALGQELVPKVTALSREIEQLKNQALEAQAIVEALRWTVSHEETELAKLKAQRKRLLLSPLSLSE